jgi:hypothetical protein
VNFRFLLVLSVGDATYSHRADFSLCVSSSPGYRDHGMFACVDCVCCDCVGTSAANAHCFSIGSVLDEEGMISVRLLYCWTSKAMKRCVCGLAV